MKTNRFTAEFPERLTDAPRPWGGNLYCEEGESSRKLIGVIYGESYADAEHNARFITAALNGTPTLTPEQTIGPEAVEALRPLAQLEIAIWKETGGTIWDTSAGREASISRQFAAGLIASVKAARAVLAKLDNAKG